LDARLAPVFKRSSTIVVSSSALPRHQIGGRLPKRLAHYRRVLCERRVKLERNVWIAASA
jgi:hypothetical protein